MGYIIAGIIWYLLCVISTQVLITSFSKYFSWSEYDFKIKLFIFLFSPLYLIIYERHVIFGSRFKIKNKVWDEGFESNIAKQGKYYEDLKYSDSSAQPRADKLPDELLNYLGTYYNIVKLEIGSDITSQTVSRKTERLQDGKTYIIRLDEIEPTRCIVRYFEETKL